MYVAVNGAWAQGCRSIKAKVGGMWTPLWPLDLSALKEQSSIHAPNCGPCLTGNKRVCMSNLTSGGFIYFFSCL